MDEQIRTAFENAPIRIQALILDDRFGPAVTAIGNDIGIENTRSLTLEDIVVETLIGITPLNTFIARIAEELDIPQKTAEQLAEAVSDDLFSQVDEALKEVHNIDIPVSAAIFSTEAPQEAAAEEQGEEPEEDKSPREKAREELSAAEAQTEGEETEARSPETQQKESPDTSNDVETDAMPDTQPPTPQETPLSDPDEPRSRREKARQALMNEQERREEMNKEGHAGAPDDLPGATNEKERETPQKNEGEAKAESDSLPKEKEDVSAKENTDGGTSEAAAEATSGEAQEMSLEEKLKRAKSEEAQQAKENASGAQEKEHTGDDPYREPIEEER